MSMEINGNYSHYKTKYAEQMTSEEDKAKETEKNAEKVPDNTTLPKDEYISSKKSDVKPSGLYWLEQSGNGNPKILFDDPKKVCNDDGEGQPKVKSDNSQKAAKKCTTNTDKVDREIKKLKEEKKQLEQQIQAASGDEKKIKELEKKLTQIESQLSQKDNDTYRRQNAIVSE